MSESESSVATLSKALRYKQTIIKVMEACKATGWDVYRKKLDKQYQFAVFNVFKAYGLDEVEGTVHITVNNGVRCSIQPTSFHRYGITDLSASIKVKLEELDWYGKSNDEAQKVAAPKGTELISAILKNFDKSARQLRRRHDDRPPYLIKDEYDVQDFLHALLRGYFHDVRSEEYTPSYAGSASRMDFLIKEDKIVIEVKFATAKLRGKEIGNQLIIDIKRYQSHPDCKYLFCLVYDPNGHIVNPNGIEKDLSKIHDGLEVKVFVVPY